MNSPCWQHSGDVHQDACWRRLESDACSTPPAVARRRRERLTQRPPSCSRSPSCRYARTCSSCLSCNHNFVRDKDHSTGVGRTGWRWCCSCGCCSHTQVRQTKFPTRNQDSTKAFKKVLNVRHWQINFTSSQFLFFLSWSCCIMIRCSIS